MGIEFYVVGFQLRKIEKSLVGMSMAAKRVKLFGYDYIIEVSDFCRVMTEEKTIFSSF